jgi:LEA14-like dessication related protein
MTQPSAARRRHWLLALAVLPLAGCAVSPFADPLRVQLAGLDSLPGEGLELRFLVRLRVQNPNGSDLAYDGVALDLDLRGQSFASGAAPVQGTVPRFGEAVVAVPVTVSGFAVARQALSLVREGGQPGGISKVAYRLSGKLGGVGPFGARFESEGVVDLAGI